MNKKKIFSYLLIVIPLVLLVLVNSKLFKKEPERTTFAFVDLPKERYLRTLKKDSLAERDGWELKSGGQDGLQGDVPVPVGADQLQIAGAVGLVADNKTGEILYGQNFADKKPIASLVKIMTALVALEHGDLDSQIVVSKRAASVGENAMGISEGEVYTLRELLYGMLLNSGNDAATAIAEGVAGNVEMFVKWMNIKSSELSLKNTYFADPSGLDDSSYSTAEDLARLTHYALKYPEFRETVKTVEQEYPYSENHKYISLYNQTNLLTTYPGVLGVKTGFTEEAGLCLVTFAVNDGKEVLGVVLNSIDRKGDMILMLDYGFSLLGVNVEHHLLN